jgi:tetratricopeptide (TPR) repeat protein
VLEIRGEDLEALNAIGTILARQENWRDLVDILEREAEEARAQGNDDLCIQIYSDLGRIWYGKLQREQSALEAWERVLEIDGTRMEALFQIAEIHRTAKQWSDVTNTLHRIVDTGTAVLDEASLEHVYMQLGWLYKNELEQPADAADAYRNALEVNPTNFDALAGLELVHREDANWEDVVGVMERRVSAFDAPDRQVEQLLAIAATWHEELENPDGGTSAFARILEVAPLHQYAFERLEALHREASRWEDLNEMYLQRVEATESVEERVALLGRVASVSEQKLSDLEQAFDALSVAWSLDYTNMDTARELERVTASANKWNELLTSANAALQETQDPAIRIAICLNCARWYGKELGHPEYAIPYYQQILALDPGNVPAMQQMGDLYRSTAQWDTLAQVLGRLVEMTKDPEILSGTFTQMGELAEERLGVPEQAPEFYYKALEQRGTNLGAMNALERIHRDNAQWPQLLDILHKKVSALDDGEQILETRLQIAETYEDRTRDNLRAVEMYKQVLDADAVNLRALKGLERLYAQMMKWPELMEVLERELDVVQTERERIAILVWMATMWEEEFLKPERAAERLEQVVDIAPMHENALMGLERLYRRMQKWSELVDTYQRHIDATPERAEKIRCFKAVGEVHSAELDDVDRAIDSYLAVLDINDNDQEALEALNKLYAKRGDHSSAIEMMEKLGRLVADPAQRVDLEFRIGQLLDVEMGDRTAALAHYVAATDIEPAHLASLEAMRKIHLDSGDWVDAARVLEQESRYTETPRNKATRLVELGKLLDENLDEHERAIQCYEQALQSDSDNEDAAMPLVREYTEHDRHAEAFPLLKMLVRRSAQRDASEQHRLAVMLGEVSARIGDTEEAIKAYGKAHQLDPQDLGALFGLAGAHFDDKDWEKASKYYQMLLMQRDSLDGDRYVEILYKLGVTKREQGEKPKALNFFDKALAEDGHHLPTLEAVVALYEDQKNYEQVVHFKKQILEVVNDDKSRFNLLEQIGDIWREKLKNHAKAIEAYHEGSDLFPQNHVILHKLLESYQQTKQWPDVIATIERISELDGRPMVRSKYSYTVGVIVRDEMKDPDAAIEKFNAALDQDPEQLKPFEAINKIYNAKKDWKGLERAYRKMLHRIIGKGKTDLEFNFWHTLGLIYRDRQKNVEAAAEAFRMASSLNPEEATEHQILAELYATIPARLEDAIGEHQWLIQRDPGSVDSYRALYQLYFQTRAYDKAWCVASTLCYLKKADPEQENFYQQYKPAGLIRPTSRLDNERWVKELFTPLEDRYVSKLMEILAGPVHALRASTDKALNLVKEKPVDFATSTVSFVKTFNFVQQVMGISMPLRLFLLDKTPGGLVDIVGAEPPAIKAGSTLLTGFSPQDLAFVVGRHLAYYRPEHFIRRIFASHTEIKMVLLAGLRIAGIGAADPNVDQWAQQLLTKMTQPQIDALRNVARKFVEAGGNADIKAWMQQVELTSCRAGFLMANDLEVAARMIQQLPPEGTTDVAPKDKIKELVLFSVSEQYFRLREALGIQIQV